MCGDGCKSVTGLVDTEGSTTLTTTFVPEFILDQTGSVYAEQTGIWSRSGQIAHVNFNLTVTTYNTPGVDFITFQLPEESGSLIDQFVNVTVFQGVEVGFFTTITVPGVIIPGSDVLTIALNFSVQPLDQWQGNFYYKVQ